MARRWGRSRDEGGVGSCVTLARALSRHQFRQHFHLHRRAQRERDGADRGPRVRARGSEDLDHQLAGAVADLGLVVPPGLAAHPHAQAHDAPNGVERAARGVAQPTAQDVFEAVISIRRRKLPDPAVLGNAGSFFKNPIVSRDKRGELIARFPSLVNYPLAGGRFKLAAGWLIDAAGLKGATRGRAGVYEKQALVLVNRGGATGGEILALAREIQAKVQEKFGVALEPEPVVI